MARVSFENMPTDGPRDPRSTARIVNQAMNGKLNAVVDFTIPIDGLPYVLQDIRISPQSWVDLMPLNPAAAISGVFWTPGDGVLNVTDPDITFQRAYCNVGQVGGSVGLSVLDTPIPGDLVPINENWDVSLIATGRIKSLVDLPSVEMTFSLSGQYETGRLYEFGVKRYLSSDLVNSVGDFSFFTSSSNQNSTVTGSFSVVYPCEIGDEFEMYGNASGLGSTLTYNCSLIADTVAGLSGSLQGDAGETPGLALDYRALIIG